jgi:hypothetical protein
MITDLPPSNGFDSILTVIDRLTKMGHFIACRKTMLADQLADLMIRHVWRLLGTPKTIVSDRGCVFISQITKELNKCLGISLHPSTAYHPRTDGQSKIANKVVEQYLHHYVGYRQENWEELLATAEFAYNNNDHTSLETLPFQANYGFNSSFGGIPSPEQCLPAVEDQLQRLAQVQEELKECLAAAQAAMATQFNRKVCRTPQWDIGDKVWLNSRQISASRTSPKLEHRWLGLFPIPSQISPSAYRLTLPNSMRGVHPIFHVSVLRKHDVDTITQRRHQWR